MKSGLFQGVLLTMLRNIDVSGLKKNQFVFINFHLCITRAGVLAIKDCLTKLYEEC